MREALFLRTRRDSVNGEIAHVNRHFCTQQNVPASTTAGGGEGGVVFIRRDGSVSTVVTAENAAIDESDRATAQR